MTRRRTHHGTTARSLLRRALAVLVLVGYALVLAGSSAGHGWGLLVHLLTEDHGAASEVEARSVAVVDLSPAVPAPAVAVSVEVEQTDDAAHRADAGHRHTHTHGGGHHHHAHGDEVAVTDEPDPRSAAASQEPPSDARPASDARPSPHAPHEHDGRTHVHGSQRDHEQSAPALPTLALDKHCLFAGITLPPPPTRDRDDTSPAAHFFSTVPPVEVPPPRTTG